MTTPAKTAAGVPKPTGEDALELQSRLALRPREAAFLIGISERCFRDHILSDPDCPRIFIGTNIRLPYRLFQLYLEKRASKETSDLPID